MDDDKIIDKLSEIGIEEKPARIYIATLESGGGLASEIAQKANIERTHTYHLLEQLIHQGLVYRSERGNRLIFVAQSPKKIEQMISTRLDLARNLIPELLSLESSDVVRPRMKVYEGIEGIKQLFEATLDLPKGSETLAYSSYKLDSQYLSQYIENYIPRRVKKGIVQRCIIDYSPESLELAKRDRVELRQSRLIDYEKFPFKNQINIFGNKIMIASYKDLMGVIIESKEIADTQRAIFELAWIGAGQTQREEGEKQKKPIMG